MRPADYKHAASGAYRARYEARVNAELTSIRDEAEAKRLAHIEHSKRTLAELESRAPRDEMDARLMPRAAERLRASIERATGETP